MYCTFIFCALQYCAMKNVNFTYLRATPTDTQLTNRLKFLSSSRHTFRTARKGKPTLR
ncbi:hypothetical protein SLEP1_g41788 [Rubroshorea leprosula]|uniref:Ribosomal protein L33 n=1 Tax=Rubroshorea leprosula TaxID=152421 RepID=A0AAV5L7T8_9ROSI|nr:hypothetical protein SLEP1_g41788 [Rubroshorea leprosula]